MQVYQLNADMDYGVLLDDNSDGAGHRWLCCRGRPSAAEWRIPWLRAPGARPIPAIDCFCALSPAGTVPILTDRAARVLAPVIGRSGELLPVAVNGRHGFWWLNCIALMAGVLDRGAMADGLPDWPPSLDGVSRWSFVQEAVAIAPPIFRLAGEPWTGSAIFATKAFADAVRNHGLLGFDLMLLWSRWTGGIVSPQRAYLEARQQGDPLVRRQQVLEKRMAAEPRWATHCGREPTAASLRETGRR